MISEPIEESKGDETTGSVKNSEMEEQGALSEEKIELIDPKKLT